jgi:hypothetical protein
MGEGEAGSEEEGEGQREKKEFNGRLKIFRWQSGIVKVAVRGSIPEVAGKAGEGRDGMEVSAGRVGRCVVLTLECE